MSSQGHHCEGGCQAIVYGRRKRCPVCTLRLHEERKAAHVQAVEQRRKERVAAQVKPCQTVECDGSVRGKELICERCREVARMAKRRERERARVVARGGTPRLYRRMDDTGPFVGIRPEMRARVEELAKRAARGESLFGEAS